LEGLVEAADAAEAGGHRHLGHGQASLMDQLLGQQHPAGLRHRHRRGAEMLAEQAAQLPFADAQPVGEALDIGRVQRAGLDQGERA
jgi:hypothetical protein